jgi:hypothetical protein
VVEPALTARPDSGDSLPVDRFDDWRDSIITFIRRPASRRLGVLLTPVLAAAAFVLVRADISAAQNAAAGTAALSR